MNFFKKIISKVGGGLLDKVAGKDGIIDQLTYSKEEKAALKEQIRAAMAKERIQLEEIALKEAEQHLRNTQGARDLQKSALQQGDRFAKRFVYYLASFWSIAGVAYIFAASFFEVDENTKNTVMGFLMGTIVATIINFFFGSAEKTPLKK